MATEHSRTAPPALNEPVALGKAVYAEMRSEDVPFMAGAIAYQSFISLLPLLVLLIVVAGTVGGEALADRLVAVTEGQLPESAQSLVEEAITGASGQAGASIIGIVTLAFGAFKIFRGLDKAFADLYDTERHSSMLATVRDGLIVFVAIIVAIVAVIGAGSAFALAEALPLGGLLAPLSLVVGLAVAFLPMYYVFPNVELSMRQVVPGVVVAAVGWAVLEALFQVYVAFAGKLDVYGVLGAVLVLVTWLYFGGLVLLVGAAVNAVLGGRGGNRSMPENDRRAAGEDDGVASLDEFEAALDGLVDEARANGVSADGMLSILRRRWRTREDVWGRDD